MYVLLCTVFVMPASAQGIKFAHGSWNEIKALAKKENKPIFIDFYTDWCVPCKKMSAETFPQQAVGDFFNKNFINVQIDAEKGEGITLKKQYQITAYPSLVFTNPNEEVIYKLIGTQGAQQLIGQGTLALHPQVDYTILKEKYANNQLSKDDVLRYMLLVKAKGSDKEASFVFDRYIGMIDAPSAEVLKMIKEYIVSTDSKAFEYLTSHRIDFEKIADKKDLDVYISQLVFNEFKEKYVFTKTSLEDFKIAKANLISTRPMTEKDQLQLDNDYYWQQRDENGYMKSSGAMIDKYYKTDDFQIANYLGGALRLPVKEKGNLLLMKEWAEKAVAIKNNSMNNITLAMIYKELRDKSNAMKYVDLGISASKRDNDSAHFIEMIDIVKKDIEKSFN